MKRSKYFLFFIFYSITLAQNPFEVYSISQQKLAERDTVGFLKFAEQAHELAPFELSFTINLAKAFAMNKQKTKCIELLDDISVIGFDYKVESDSGFMKVWKHSLLKEISARAKKNSSAQVSTTAFILPENDLIPEGITYDPRRNVFYLSSIYKRKILAVLPDGSTFDFAGEASNGLMSTLGMRVDAARDQLWVLSTIQSAHARKVDQSEIGKSVVHQYDLGTKRFIQSYAPTDSLSHMFNDLTTLANGDVYLTDSKEGAVYKIDSKTKTLRRWFKSESLIYPNGITSSPDQQYIFVAHWTGISRISVADTHDISITMKTKNTIAGIDGLYLYGNSLIGVQNGAGPQSRIMKFELNSAMDAVVKATILESDHPNHNIPTTGVIVGDEFYYIANSQLESFSVDGKIFPQEQLEPTYILKLPLTD